MWKQVFARNSSFVDNWTSVTITGGGGTFVGEENALVGGGVPYKGSGSRNAAVQNRFIIWRCSKAQEIELAEYSLNFPLKSSGLRVSVKNDVILPGGIVVTEIQDAVIVLLSLASSIHRFVFPHPSSLSSSLSIFSSVSSTSPSYGYVTQTLESQVSGLVASAWAMQSGEAWFCRGTSSGSLHLVYLPLKGDGMEMDLKETSVMQRLWNDFIPKAIRSAASSGNEAVADVCMHGLSNDLVAIAISQDLKLRVWSVKERKLLEVLNFATLHDVSTAAQNVQVRVSAAKGRTHSSVSIAVYVSSRRKSIVYICCFKMENGATDLAVSANFYYDQEPILSWDISQGLLLSLQGNRSSLLRYLPFDGQPSKADLGSDLPDGLDIALLPTEDVDEVYLNFILSRKQFSRTTVLRTLQLWRPSLFPMEGGDLTEDELQSVIIETIKDHMNESGCVGMDSTEWRALYVSSWSQFFSNCRDYQMEEDCPIGLFNDSSTGMICIISVGSLSFLRPADWLERYMLSSTLPEFQVKNVKLIVDCVNSLLQIMSNRQLSFDYHQSGLSLRQQADEIAISIWSMPVENGEDSLEEQTLSQLQSKKFDLAALSRLLDLLQPTLLSDLPKEPSLQLLVSHLYASPLGVAIVCETFAQLVSSRRDFALGLLVYCCLLVNLASKIGLQLNEVYDLKAEVMTELESVAAGYMALAATVSQKPKKSTESLDLHVRQLSTLNLSNLNFPSQEEPSSVLEMYLSEVGCQRLCSDLASSAAWGPKLQTSPCEYWTLGLMAAVQTLLAHLWPGRQLFFGEVLLANSQYSILEKFISFCRVSQLPCPGTLLFLESQCLIQSQDFHGAYRCMLRAAGSLDEPFFEKMIGVSDKSEDDLRIHYYMKAIQILEEIPASDLVINMASKVISEIGADHPHAAMFWSSKFKHLLEKDDVDGAYVALTANPDLRRRTDYLRHFVMVLCEKGRKKELCSYPYVGLSDQVSSVLESRARGADLAVNNFYDILYSFHTLKGNFRKAAFYMCECASRLALEFPGVESLQKQSQCYLAALNSLRLVDKLNAWIVRPSQWEGIAIRRYREQNKRKRGHKEPNDSDRSLVKVLSIDQLKLEYILISSTLHLLESTPDSINPAVPCVSPEEAFSLLTQSGCFDVAVKLAKSFHLDLKPVFEALAMRCAKGSADSSMANWDWLSFNETSRHLTKVGSFSEQAWLFLHEYEKLARSSGHEVLSTFYQSIANSLLGVGCHLPQWFIESYMAFFPSQLIHLFLQYGMIEDASRLTSTYLSTAKENDASLWTPMTAIDNLKPFAESQALIENWKENTQRQ